MAWYLPVLLLTIFRPNLEDRVAITAWAKAGFRRRLAALAGAERARRHCSDARRRRQLRCRHQLRELGIEHAS